MCRKFTNDQVCDGRHGGVTTARLSLVAISSRGSFANLVKRLVSEARYATLRYRVIYKGSSAGWCYRLCAGHTEWMYN